MREVCDNTILRDDRRDEFMIGHIEGGVIDVYSIGSHALFVPHVGDFLGGRCSIWMSLPVEVARSMVELGAQT